LGNRRHILRAGVVCDRCNHYFGGKLEHTVLKSQYFNNLRARQALPSRKGNPIFGTSLLNVDGTYIPSLLSRQAMTLIFDPTPLPSGEQPWDKLLSASKVELLFPLSGGEPEEWVFSRFLAKMAFEAMAARVCHVDGYEEFLFDPQFDPIRNWARFGAGCNAWPFHIRRLYAEEGLHSRTDEKNGLQVLFEFDFLQTENNEFFFAICFFGVEFAINFGGPEIDGYEAWLKANNFISPLYSGKNGAFEVPS
jgi:hypothetical protein